jgi:hypothetical protein
MKDAFKGRSGSVPRVDPADFLAVYQLYKKAQHEIGERFSLGIKLIRSVCNPGAEVIAVTYRVMYVLAMEKLNSEIPLEARIRTDEEGLIEAASSFLEWPK